MEFIMKRILATIALAIAITHAGNVFAGKAECINQCNLTFEACMANCKNAYDTQKQAILAERAACLANATTSEQKQACKKAANDKMDVIKSQILNCRSYCK